MIVVRSGFDFDAKLPECELDLPDPIHEFHARDRRCGSGECLSRFRSVGRNRARRDRAYSASGFIPTNRWAIHRGHRHDSAQLAEKVMFESEQRFRSIADSAHAPTMKARSRLP
jgi:hypothetical protein